MAAVEGIDEQVKARSAAVRPEAKAGEASAGDGRYRDALSGALSLERSSLRSSDERRAQATRGDQEIDWEAAS